MVEFPKLWRGLKRLILAGDAAELPPVGDVAVRTGRQAVAVVGRHLDVRGVESRGELPQATGLSMAGLRATTWLTDAGAALAVAVDQRLPLVAHLAPDDDRGDAAHQAAARAGWVVFHPQTVQEAVDLTLAAHHFAEHALHPVLVVHDAAAVADAVQDVRLPDAALCRAAVGRAADTIPAPTPAQELLFGASRRRVPRYFDLDRPTMHGVGDPGLAAASGRAFFRRHFAAQIEVALHCVAEHTKRPLSPLHVSGAGGSGFCVVTQGATVELAENVAAALRERDELDFTVIGVRCPDATTDASLSELLEGMTAAVVLQPATALAADKGLLEALLPVPTIAAYHGFPGHPLRAADLMSLCRAVHAGRRDDACLGLDFLPESSDYPKREVLLQSLRRDYGELESLGHRAGDEVDLRGAGATTLAVTRSAAAGGEEFAPGVGDVLGCVLGGTVRSRFDRQPRGYGATSVDRLTIGPGGMREAGAGVPADALVLLYGSIPADLRLADGASVLVPLAPDDTLASLPADTLRTLRERRAELFTIETGNVAVPHEAPLPEAVLGAACGMLQARGIELRTPRAVRARSTALAHLSEPQRRERLADFERGVEAVRRVDPATLPEAPSAPGGDDIALPRAVRDLESGSGTFDSVPRFWDHVGVLYRHGHEADLSPDPFQATGALPPLTATFHDLSTRRRTIRVFDPEACTGCGDCWSVCPDTALGPAAFTFEDVLTAGMVAAKEEGANADGLRPMLGKIAARAKKLVGEATEAADAPTVGPVLRSAFEYVLEKTGEDRRAALQDAFDPVFARVAALPAAQAKPFFEHGQLLTVAVHVEACKACGACTEVCETAAITGQPQTAERIASARRNWSLFERLPDAGDDTLARTAEDESVGAAASLLLDRHSMFTLSGGDPAEPGSGEKVAVHLAMAAAERHVRPLLQQHLATVADLERQVSAKIGELLAESLPTEDLGNLRRTLDDVAERHVDLATLAARAGADTPVDADWLRRLVASAEELRDLQKRLATGLSGLGRARVGLLVAKGNVATWAAAFPYNPFPVPVVLDRAGAAAEVAKGLCRGQLESTVDDFRLLRRARMELTRPAEAHRAAAACASLTWQDLEPEERASCPPLLLIGGDDSLGARGLTALATVLSDELPIKLLVLAGLDFGLMDDSRLGRTASAADTPHGDTGLLAMAHRNAFVVQSSVGDPDHLVNGCRRAFEHPGPALVHVHAPSPQRHGFATHLTREQGRRALLAGAFPRFTYDPGAVGLFGLRLSLQEESDPEQTFAHFAVTEGRFAHHFAELPPEAPEPTHLVDYLALDARGRSGKTPYLESDGHRLAVSAAMVAACEDRRHAMRVLQELCGVVTPFTAKVEAEVEDRNAAGHAKELDALRKEYEGKLAAMRSELHQEFTVRLRDRLVELAARHRADSGVPR